MEIFMAHSKKVENITESLRKRVLKLLPGEPLDPIRDLMKLYDVSQVTITKAMQQLKEEKLLESRPGHGTFRSSGNTRHPKIVMLQSNFISSFSQNVSREMEKHFTAKGYEFHLSAYDKNNVVIDKKLLNGTIDALIINMHQDISPSLMIQINSLKIPVLLLDIMPQTVCIDAVCTDNELGGAIVANYFLSKGFTRCGMLQSMPHFHNCEARQRRFMRQLKLSGHEGIFIDCQTQSGENSTVKAYETFSAYLKENGCKIEALFCDSDLGSLGVLKACQENNIRIPEDMSIIGFDNTPECDFFHPSLSSVDQNITQWAIEAEKIISSRLAGNKQSVFRSYVTPELILRDSTVK